MDDMDGNSTALSVTNAAVAQLKRLMTDHDEPAVGFRVGVRNGGCSGMAYTMDFASEQNSNDEVIDVDGITVLIDPTAIMFLIGTEMDYVKQNFGANFVFRNPNETSRCGCGESFSV